MAAESSKPKRIGVLLYPQFEVLDAYGPIEALNSLVHIGHAPDLEFYTIARTPTSGSTLPVSDPSSTSRAPEQPGSRFGQRMVVDATFDQALALDLDVLLIPGGLGSGPYLPPDFTTPGPDMDAEISFVRSVFPRLHSLITVCTGAGIAARAGVLDGRRATTNKYAWNVQTTLGHRTHWVAKARWVVDGNVVTCSGVSAGIDGMLAWIGAVWGEEVADTIADGMEFERTKEAGEDRFAALNGCEDVPPKE